MEPLKFEDFVPKWAAAQEEAEVDQAAVLRAKAAQVFAAFGGVDTSGS